MDAPSGATGTAARPRWQVPPLPEDRLLGGVAAAAATELGVDPLAVRAAFVVLALAGGWGIVLYGALWLWFERAGAAATAYRPEPKAAGPVERNLGFGLVVLGLLLLVRAIGFGFADAVVWPALLVVAGALVAWQRGALELGGARRATVRLAVGAALVGAGFLVFALSSLDLGVARDTLLAVAAIGGGLAVVAGPWARRIVTSLDEERRRRIRTEERAAVAAHLHDSVLQTLALIQRGAADPAATVALARRQERELRDWLYGTERPPGRFADRLDGLGADIERRFGVVVEVVTVGDTDVDDRVEAVLAAAGEAVVNAAKHAGVGRVDVYGEVRPDALDVFVRDTGVGFDPAAVGPDRHGLADSVVGRMRRAGGAAVVDSRPGAGTEVELRLPLADGREPTAEAVP